MQAHSLGVYLAIEIQHHCTSDVSSVGRLRVSSLAGGDLNLIRRLRKQVHLESQINQGDNQKEHIGVKEECRSAVRRSGRRDAELMQVDGIASRQSDNEDGDDQADDVRGRRHFMSQKDIVVEKKGLMTLPN